VTYASFIVLYPEFAETTAALVTAKINEATSLETAALWGSDRDSAIALHTAAALAGGPLGEQAFLSVSDNKEGSNKYAKELQARREKRLRTHHCGFVLI
jgi:hypothetical protein